MAMCDIMENYDNRIKTFEKKLQELDLIVRDLVWIEWGTRGQFDNVTTLELI